MRALQLLADRELALGEREAPAPPASGEFSSASAVGLNHIDVWGFRGMAFAKRQFPLCVGAEAACDVIAVGDGVTACSPAICGAVCGAGMRHVPGLRARAGEFVRERRRRAWLPRRRLRPGTDQPSARLFMKLPDGVDLRDAACVAVAYATVEHMLFDNARLEPGETILVHAGGSGIGCIAIRVAKALGCTVITTVGSEDKATKAHALGADHVINYREDRFEGVVRKLTSERASTWYSNIPAPTHGTVRCYR